MKFNEIYLKLCLIFKLSSYCTFYGPPYPPFAALPPVFPPSFPYITLLPGVNLGPPNTPAFTIPTVRTNCACDEFSFIL